VYSIEPCPDTFGHRHFRRINKRAVMRVVEQASQFSLSISALTANSYEPGLTLARDGISTGVEFESPRGPASSRDTAPSFGHSNFLK
jgi:hypothetical protein